MSRAISAKTARERANIAAAIIRRGSAPTRELDNCFEMGDGDEVCRILWQRVDARPESVLARNISRYVIRPDEGR